MVKITVAMASYNHADFIRESIESVLSQKNCDFELIIVDDGSQDATADIVRTYQDARITFIPLSENQGACVALRKAIEAGQGEYVAILNSDDAFLPGKLEKQAALLDTDSKIDAVFGLPQFINQKGDVLQPHQHFYRDLFRQKNRTRHEWLNHFFYKSNALCHPTVMLRRTCYENLGYYDPRMAQLPDFDFWVRLALKYNIHVLEEELIRFRILNHEANASAPTIENIRRAHWEFSYILPHFLKLDSLDEYLKVFPEDQAFMQTYSHCPTKYLIPYALAQKSLSDKIFAAYASVYHFFGLQILFNLFKEPEFVEFATSTLKMNLAQCSQIAKYYDIFDLKAAKMPPLYRRGWNYFKKKLKGKS